LRLASRFVLGVTSGVFALLLFQFTPVLASEEAGRSSVIPEEKKENEEAVDAQKLAGALFRPYVPSSSSSPPGGARVNPTVPAVPVAVLQGYNSGFLLLASRYGWTDGVRTQLQLAKLANPRVYVDKDYAGVEISRSLGTNPGETALTLAARHGHFDAVKSFFEFADEGDDFNVNHYSQNGENALHNAIRGGYLYIARYLLDEAKADVTTPTGDKRSPLWIALELGHSPFVRELLFTPEFRLRKISHDFRDIVRKYQKEIDAHDYRTGEDKNSALRLLDLAATLNYLNGNINCLQSDQMKHATTLVCRGIECNRVEEVRALVQAKADLNPLDSSVNPLHAAVVHDRADIVPLLLEHNAQASILAEVVEQKENVAQQNKPVAGKITPFGRAVNLTRPKIVKALLDSDKMEYVSEFRSAIENGDTGIAAQLLSIMRDRIEEELHRPQAQLAQMLSEERRRDDQAVDPNVDPKVRNNLTYKAFERMKMDTTCPHCKNKVGSQLVANRIVGKGGVRADGSTVLGKVVVTKCGHIYCEDCYKEGNGILANCSNPKCRKSFDNSPGFLVALDN